MASTRAATRGTVAVIAVAAVVVLLTGCDKVDKPTSDSSAPSLQWTVLDETTKQSTTIAGQGDFPGVRGRSYNVTLKAIDAQGIHEIRLGSSTAWGCKSGNLGQSHGPSLDTEDVQVLNPDADGKVLTEIFLLRSTSAIFDCSSGFTFSGGTTSMFGTGKNYFNGVTKGTLKINVGP